MTLRVIAKLPSSTTTYLSSNGDRLIKHIKIFQFIQTYITTHIHTKDGKRFTDLHHQTNAQNEMMVGARLGGMCNKDNAWWCHHQMVNHLALHLA